MSLLLAKELLANGVVNIINKSIKIIPLLINIQTNSKIEQVFKTFNIDTVYHAAAYKHVPLVEENICEGVKNNVFGTYSIGQIAIQHNVSNFVLISSDKAVRATNIMGASKRLAEICVQSLHNDSKDKHTKFAIVRFGNVLQSSGSVIPKFKKQIKQGGPVTLTHPEVTRYFMTITEASQLVIQAGAMSKGCEVFILDMGESVKIKDLIYKMIKLSGLIVKNTKNSEGDIEVKITGLRPGEKLYEELLVKSEELLSTHNELIFIAQKEIVGEDLLNLIDDLIDLAFISSDHFKIVGLMKKIVPEYISNHSEFQILDNNDKNTL